MTENNEIKERKIKELAETFKEKDNPKNDNTLNGVILPDDEGTNITELENDIKKLEKEIFTEDNLKNIKAEKDSDLYNFLNNNKYTINNIINNAHQLSEIEITNFLINNKVYKKDQFCSEHGFAAALFKGKAGHFCTYKDEKVIFNSSDDGRQFDQCCGIHAIEGVLIAEALKSNEEIAKFKAKHNNQLVKTSEDDLIEQRKILFKMEILDALISQNDKSYLSSFTITPEGIASYNTNAKETPDEERKRRECEALHKLYLKEFQARCATLQVVEQELGLEPDKVKLDKVPEAPKVETPKQSASVTPQQIKQKKEVTPETPKVEIQQAEIKKEKAPKVETEAQKPVRQVVVENPEEEIEQKKEDKQQDKTAVKNKEDAKKFDLPKPKQENGAVNTQEVTEKRPECDTPSKEEPCSSRDTESSTASSTSTSKTPRYKVLERTGAEEKDAGFETYDVNNQPIDIDDESVKLYKKFLDQVLEEFKKEGKIVNIDLIKKKVEEKLFACFSIRNEKGEIISEDNYSDKDKKDIALAKEDYKYTAEHSELIKNRFNAIEKALKEYNERLTGANREVHERILKGQEQEKATASIKMQ